MGGQKAMRKLIGTAMLLMVCACKPPPSDESASGKIARTLPDAPPAPLTSPDTTGAIWAPSKTQGRLIYGQPGKSALMALRCLSDGTEALIEITRLSPADKGGKALLAIVGRRTVLRMPLDAIELGGRRVWQGVVMASNRDLAALTDEGEAHATLPGGGAVILNPSKRPGELVARCRASLDPRPEPGEEGALADSAQP